MVTRARSRIDRSRSRAGFGLLAAALGVALLLSSAPAARALPAGYAYEMVSPADKGGGGVALWNGFQNGEGAISMDGNRMLFTSNNSFADGAGNPITSFYRAKRGATSWSTVNLTPRVFSTPNFFPAQQTPILAASEDLGKVVISTNSDPVTGVMQTRDNLYLYDVEADSYRLLTPDPVAGPDNYRHSTVTSAGVDAANIVGFTPDLKRVLYTTRGLLTPDSAALSTTEVKAYVVDTESGEPELVSVLGGTPGTPISFPYSSTELLGPGHHNSRVLSDDGAKVIFKSASGDFYQRDLATGETTELPGVYEDASADGRYVFVTTLDPLTASDTDAGRDLYRLDMDAAPDLDPELISVDSEPGDVSGSVGSVVAADPTGGSVYFSGGDQLVAGAPTGPGDKLYAWDEGELNYVAGGEFGYGSSGVAVRGDTFLSSDGRYLAFISDDQLLSGQWGAADCLEAIEDPGVETFRYCDDQIYRYDLAASDPAAPDLICVSCLPGPEGTPSRSKFRYTGASAFNAPSYRSYVSDTGEVVFSTRTPLLPDDTNGFVEDAYLFNGEELELLSTGRGSYPVASLGGTPDFSTLMITTHEQLSGWDGDGDRDLYAARKGGGLPEPPPAVPACSGDDCQAAAGGAPAFATPVTDRTRSRGNAASGGQPRRCARLTKKAKRVSKRAKRVSRRANRVSRQAGRAGRKSKPAASRTRRARQLRHQAKRARRAARACRRAAR